MALNISESAAVNTIVDCLANKPSPGGKPRTEEDLRHALRTLAQSASKALMAGVRPEQIDGLALPNYAPTTEPMVSVESIRMALRDAHRNDSAADAVEFVSDLVGWDADDDPELQEAK